MKKKKQAKDHAGEESLRRISESLSKTNNLGSEIKVLSKELQPRKPLDPKKTHTIVLKKDRRSESIIHRRLRESTYHNDCIPNLQGKSSSEIGELMINLNIHNEALKRKIKKLRSEKEELSIDKKILYKLHDSVESEIQELTICNEYAQESIINQTEQIHSLQSILSYKRKKHNFDAQTLEEESLKAKVNSIKNKLAIAQKHLILVQKKADIKHQNNIQLRNTINNSCTEREYPDFTSKKTVEDLQTVAKHLYEYSCRNNHPKANIKERIEDIHRMISFELHLSAVNSREISSHSLVKIDAAIKSTLNSLEDFIGRPKTPKRRNIDRFSCFSPTKLLKRLSPPILRHSLQLFKR